MTMRLHWKKLLFISLIACFCFSHNSTAQERQEKDLITEVRISTEKYVLDNGLTVLLSRMPHSPMVSVYALVKAGSATEGEYLGSGISHFMEHMLFRGTRERDAGQIAAEIQSLGGVINASTSFDCTVYKITVPQKYFQKALVIIADMLRNAKFDPKDIAVEREVVYNEMRMGKDDPSRYLSELNFKNVYRQHPYRLPVIGYEDLLKDLKREDFLSYYHTFYVPNNTVLSVAGGMDAEECLQEAKKIFGDWKRGRYAARNFPSEPVQVTQRRYEEAYPSMVTRVALSFSGVSLLDQDMFALDVLAMILGDGEDSRLYKELFRKQGIVESISAYNFTPLDRGFFSISCVPRRGKRTDTVIARIMEQIDLIKKEGVLPAELQKAERQILSGFVRDYQTSSDVAYLVARDEAFMGDFAAYKNYVAQVKKVTNEDIQRVADAYCQENSLSVTILSSQDGKDVLPQEAPSVEETEIKKVILDNGLVLLLKEDQDLPLVSMDLALKGGTRVENDTNNGLSRLLCGLWTKGTKTKTAEAIAEQVESRGMSLGGFSGRNSLGLSMEFLSDDMMFAVDLLEDLVGNPSFDAQELKKEKEKIQTKIKLQKDSVFYLTFDKFRKTLFKTHSLKYDSLGTAESIAHLSRAEIVRFYKDYAVANNMVLSIFGDFDAEEIESLVRQKFSGIAKRDLVFQEEKEAPPVKMREAEMKLDKKQAMVLVGFQAMGLLDEDRFGMEVLAAILGSPFDGRVFNQVREDLGKAYQAGGNFLPALDGGMVYFYALTSADSIEKVKKIIMDIIEEIRSTDVQEEELQNAKSYLKGTFQMSIETNASLGFTSALNELYGLGYDYHKAHDAFIDKITKADIKRLAQEYLDLDNAVVTITHP